MTASLDKICMVLLSMMYLPLACSYSCGLSCKAAEDGLILKEVLQSCHLSNCKDPSRDPSAAAGTTQPRLFVGADWHSAGVVTCASGSQPTSEAETGKSHKTDLKALFLNACLIQHIHISRHFCQIIHFLPLNASPGQKFLDVCLHMSEIYSSGITIPLSIVQHMG